MLLEGRSEMGRFQLVDGHVPCRPFGADLRSTICRLASMVEGRLQTNQCMQQKTRRTRGTTLRQGMGGQGKVQDVMLRRRHQAGRTNGELLHDNLY